MQSVTWVVSETECLHRWQSTRLCTAQLCDHSRPWSITLTRNRRYMEKHNRIHKEHCEIWYENLDIRAVIQPGTCMFDSSFSSERSGHVGSCTKKLFYVSFDWTISIDYIQDLLLYIINWVHYPVEELFSWFRPYVKVRVTGEEALETPQCLRKLMRKKGFLQYSCLHLPTISTTIIQVSLGL